MSFTITHASRATLRNTLASEIYPLGSVECLVLQGIVYEAVIDVEVRQKLGHAGRRVEVCRGQEHFCSFLCHCPPLASQCHQLIQTCLEMRSTADRAAQCGVETLTLW